MQTLNSPLGGSPIVYSGEKPPIKPICKTRWVNFSAVKSGKTGLLTSIPRCLVLDTEKKCHLVKNARSDYQEISSLVDFRKMIDWLCALPVSQRPWDTIGVDTLDELLYGLAIPGLTDEIQKKLAGKSNIPEDIREYKSGGKGSGGWDIVTSEVVGYFRRLGNAGYGWFANGHIKEKEDGSKRPAVNPQLYAGMYRAAEFIVGTELKPDSVHERVPVTKRVGSKDVQTSETRVTTRMVGTVRMQLTKADSTNLLPDIGGNLTMPSELVLAEGYGWDTICEAYKEAVAKAESVRSKT